MLPICFARRERAGLRTLTNIPALTGGKERPPELRRLFYRFVRGANFAGEAASFLFEGADTEVRGAAAVDKVFGDERLESAAAFALSDVHQLMKKQLAVLPAIGADDDAVTKGDAARGVGDDLAAARGVGELLVVRERDAIDDQHAHPC